MQTSERGRDLIKRFEGLRLDAYQDLVGKWTIGYGSTHGVKAGDKFTADEAEARLIEDLRLVEAGIRRRVIVPLNQNEFDALASFVFNLGEGALAKSTLLRLLNGKKRQAAAMEFVHWCFAGGTVVDGLRLRREAEQALFLASPKEGA